MLSLTVEAQLSYHNPDGRQNLSTKQPLQYEIDYKYLCIHIEYIQYSL